MKRRNLLARGLVCLLAMALLCGCGASGGKAVPEGGANAAPMAPMEDAASGSYGEERDMAASDAGASVSPTDPRQNAKLIYTGRLELETTAFDDVRQSLETLVERCGGYLESNSVSSRGGGYRYADYTVRVPAEQYKEFYTQAGELCHVLWQNQETENITEVYYDTAGRLKTQATKLERLQTLLARAETMEDIITIESAISETEQAIEALSGTLRHYDALVGYSTVRLSISEVYKLSNTEEAATGFTSRVGGAFVSGWNGFVDAMENLAVALAYGWIWVVLLAAAAVTAIRVLRKRRRKDASPRPPQDPPPRP